MSAGAGRRADPAGRPRAPRAGAGVLFGPVEDPAQVRALLGSVVAADDSRD